MLTEKSTLFEKSGKHTLLKRLFLSLTISFLDVVSDYFYELRLILPLNLFFMANYSIVTLKLNFQRWLNFSVFTLFFFNSLILLNQKLDLIAGGWK